MTAQPGPGASSPPDASGVPTFAELDVLSTDELRHRAVEQARRRHDLCFFWDLVKHLPAASDTADADASSGGTFETLQDAIELFREMRAGDFGEHEPMVRERFISYLRTPEH
jgi:hypothetical protein